MIHDLRKTMRKIESLEELKLIQLDLLLQFHQFCCVHSIKYSLAAGTLIGAVRHKGFIPWDDDIDVYLLREDYMRLIKLFPNEPVNNCVLVSLERDDKWHKSYAKFYDNRTLADIATRNHYDDLGIGIDVFPIDDVPDNLLDFRKYNKKRMLLRDAIFMKSFPFSKKRSLLKTISILGCQMMLLPFSFEYLAKKLNRYSQKHNGKGYSHVNENCLGVYNTIKPWLKKDFDQVIDAEFEGHQVKIMEGYNDYLSTIYGDYMTLPPVEKRKAHHGFVGYWKDKYE